ncbi:MAG: glycosyltransferase, partial [Saprospiraceae bacterium]|nr:glycosyltransferase [Saprospiraceae bacterium]
MSPRELSEVTINIDRENSGTVKRRIKPKSTTCFIAFNPQFDGKQEVLLKGIEKLQASLPQVKVQLVLYGDDTYPGDLDLSQYSVLKFPEVDRLAKAYNQAVKHCDSDYLIFCRAGLVLKVADYQATLAALQDFDAVAPYSMEARLTDSPNTTESLPLQRTERIMTTHFGTHFFAIRRSAFEYLGGWDQGFSDSLLGSFAFSYILTRLCSTLSLHRSRLQEDL